VDVLDTNLWALGFTDTDPAATELIAEIRDGDLQVAVSAYLYCEVMAVFEQADYVAPAAIEATKSNFSAFLYKCSNIRAPSQQAVERCSLVAARTGNNAMLIQSLSGVEAKDAPILSFAYGLARRRGGPEPIQLYTADRAFAAFDAEAAGLQNLRLEYIEPSGRVD
jgi:hypothetical protein